MKIGKIYPYLDMKIIYAMLSFFLIPYITFSQNTVQDCQGAIPICQMFYDEPDPYKYKDNGKLPNEIYDNYNAYECITEENNGVWYTFTAQTTGLLRFVITSHDPKDDYDWIVFDMTTAQCADLGTSNMIKYMVSSNNYGADTVLHPKMNRSTGANTDSAKVHPHNMFPGFPSGNCNGLGEEKGPPWNDDIMITQGKTYMIYVSNWSRSNRGYSIDFKNTTSSIYDTIRPNISEILYREKIACGSDYVYVKFSENIRCNTVQTSDFQVIVNNTSVPIKSISSADCASGYPHSREYRIDFSSPLEAGNYQIKLTGEVLDLCGNVSHEGILNFKPFLPYIKNIIITNPKCFNSTDGAITINTLNNGFTNLQYSIDGGKNFFNYEYFQNLSRGTYHIMVQNNNTCRIDSGIKLLTSPPEIIIDSLIIKNIRPCFGDNNGHIQLYAKGGTGLLNYTISSMNYNGEFSNLAPGSYTATIRDEKNCAITQHGIIVTQPEKLTLTNSKVTNPTCFGFNNGLLEVNVNGGISPYKYIVNENITVSTGNFPKLSEGIYKLSVVDNNNCSIKDEYTLKSPEKITNIITNIFHVTCYGYNNGNFEHQTQGGIKPYVFFLSHQNGTIVSDTTALIAGKYTLKITDNNNCEKLDSFEILQPEALKTNLEIKDVTCNGGSDGSATALISGGTSPYYMLWFNGETQNNTTGLNAGKINVIVADKNNCMMKVDGEITQPQVIALNLNANHPLCFGNKNGNIYASVTGGSPFLQYQWNTGDSTLDINNLQAGRYVLKVIDTQQKECAEAAIYLKNPELLKIEIDSFRNTCNDINNGSIYFKSQGGTPPYSITTNNYYNLISDSLYNLTSGSYRIQIMDSQSCLYDTTMIILQVECSSYLWVPDIFTPNGDGINDIFKVKHRNLTWFKCVIFSRWGRELWSYTDPDKGWKGKEIKDLDPSSSGVYFYLVTAEGKDGKKYNIKGFLQLQK